MMPQKSILCIEPASHNQVLLKLVINHLSNCFSACFEKGEDALSYLQSNHVDLIITELCLPGIKGEEVIEKLRAAADTQNIPIIVVTSIDDTDRVSAVKKLGCLYLVKPYEIQALMSLIGEFIGQKT